MQALNISYSVATADDFSSIIDLQSRNLLINLSDSQIKNGFLSVEFSLDMLSEVVADICIIKAHMGNNLVGYMMAQTLNFNMRFPLLATIITRFPHIEYNARKLSEYKSFIIGPSCIAEGYRGFGTLEGMFHAMLEVVREQFEVGVTFISRKNLRSLSAAQNKLGMSVVDDIRFENKDFAVLAFGVKN